MSGGVETGWFHVSGPLSAADVHRDKNREGPCEAAGGCSSAEETDSCSCLSDDSLLLLRCLWINSCFQGWSQAVPLLLKLHTLLFSKDKSELLTDPEFIFQSNVFVSSLNRNKPVEDSDFSWMILTLWPPFLHVHSCSLEIRFSNKCGDGCLSLASLLLLSNTAPKW